MTGWETLNDAIPSDNDQFGGQYLNRLSSLLTGGDIGLADPTLKPLIGTDWTFKYGKVYLNDALNDNYIQILADNQSLNTAVKIPTQSFTPDYIVLRKQSEELENKTIDYTKNSFPNLPVAGGSSAGGLASLTSNGTLVSFNIPHTLPSTPTVVNVSPANTTALGSFTVSANPTNIVVTYIVAPPSGTVQLYWNAGFGTILYGTSMNAANNWTAPQTFFDQQLLLRNPANNYSLKFRNPAITADSDFQFNAPYAYYIFVDADDGNKIKCKDNRTGAIVSSHATNADVPINYAIGQLATTGGTIFLGRGTFDVYLQIAVANPSINIVGSGRGVTKIRRQIPTSVQTLMITASNCCLRHLTVDGNYPTNQTISASEVVFNVGTTGGLCYDIEVRMWKGTGAINNHGSLVIDSCKMVGPNVNASIGQYCVLAFTDSVYTMVRNCDMQYGSLDAVWGSGVTIIEGCYIANNAIAAGGQIAMNSGGTSRFCGVYNNTIDRGLGGDSGVEMANADWEVIGNYISGQTANGITSSPAENQGYRVIKNNIVKNCGLPGISIQSNQLYMIIEGNICCDDQTPTATQPYGIVIAHIGAPYSSTNANHYIVKNNICFGNTQGQILDLGTGTDKYVGDNIGYVDHNGGLATITTNGSTASFTIPHGLSGQPSVVNVVPQTADARGNYYVTVDPTNITVIYPIAPPNTSPNKLWWNARVNPM